MSDKREKCSRGVLSRLEEYRRNSNRDDFLSLDFGLREFGEMEDQERLQRYRRFLYETGAMEKKDRKSDAGGRRSEVRINRKMELINRSLKMIVEKERKNNYELTRARRFGYRTRYFTDSGIVGGKAFVSKTYRKAKRAFQAKRDKIPKPFSGLSGVYSLKRLRERYSGRAGVTTIRPSGL